MREQSSIPHLFADKSGVDGGANVVGVGRAGGPVHAEHVDILLKYEVGSESERLGLGKLKMEIFVADILFVSFSNLFAVTRCIAPCAAGLMEESSEGMSCGTCI